MNEEWVGVKKAAVHYSVSIPTIRRWADSGKVQVRRTPSMQRQINIGSKDNTVKNDGFERSNFVYVRVSSFKQKDDLERQASFLSERYPEYRIVKDIGSGINYRRKGLLSLLEQVETNSVREIVVASKDRLCRFGFELIEWICNKHGTKIVVLEQNNESPEAELGNELLDIIQVFCCRRNGKRRYGHQKLKIEDDFEAASKTHF